MYMQAIITITFVVLAFFFMPESYAPVLLKRKAVRLRKTTGDERYWHPHEDVKMKLDNIVSKHFSRPLRMFFTEPMVTCICVYASFVYGLLFLCIEVFPIVFFEERSYSLVVSTLPFIGMFVGCLIAVGINIANQPFYVRAVEKTGKGRAVPEARLPPMIIGGCLLTTGLFWFGWTSAPKYHWALPVVAAGEFFAIRTALVQLLTRMQASLAQDSTSYFNSALTSSSTPMDHTPRLRRQRIHFCDLCLRADYHWQQGRCF